MDVLAGNEAGQRTAKEGAHGAKLLGLAEAPGRDAVHLPPPRFLVAYVIALHGHAGHLLLPVGVKSLRQKVVDRHVIASDIDRKSTRLNPVTNAHLVCRLLLEKKNIQTTYHYTN